MHLPTQLIDCGSQVLKLFQIPSCPLLVLILPPPLLPPRESLYVSTPRYSRRCSIEDDDRRGGDEMTVEDNRPAGRSPNGFFSIVRERARRANSARALGADERLWNVLLMMTWGCQPHHRVSAPSSVFRLHHRLRDSGGWLAL